jgi:hypothetical protein
MVSQKIAAAAFLPIQTAIALITGTKAIAEVTAAEAATLGLATVAIIGGLAMVIGAMSSSKSKVNDGFFPAAGGSGHGKRMLVGPEGAIQLNNKDSVIAGTDLFKKSDDMISGPKGAITVSNSNAPSSPLPDSNALLIAEMKRGNNQREEQLRLQKRDTFVSTIRVQ